LRVAALEKLTDPAVLAQVVTDDPSPDLRRKAILKVKDGPLLLRIAKNEADQMTLLAALVNLKDRQSLVELARTARYKSTRAMMTARLTFSWHRDVQIGTTHYTVSPQYTDCEVPVTNGSQEFAYSGFKFVPPGVAIDDPEKLPDMGGTVEPGQKGTIKAALNGDWRGLLERNPGPIQVLGAIPLLPNGATDLSAGGIAEPYVAGPNRAPEIAAQHQVRTTTSSNVLAQILGVTTEITIDAWDPDFDPLTFEWTASNGSIAGNGPVGVWKRVVENSRLVPGTVTVTVSDGRGGKTTATYEMK